MRVPGSFRIEHQITGIRPREDMVLGHLFRGDRWMHTGVADTADWRRVIADRFECRGDAVVYSS
jgi:hypothetical protein